MNKSFSPSRLGLATGVLTASIFLAGCSKVSQQVQNKVQSTVQQAATAALTEADLAGISDPLVRKNLVAQANTHAFETVTSSGVKGTGVTTTDIEISGSDLKMHTTTQVGGKTEEMIIIGDTTYVKDPTDNSWWMQVNQATPDASGSANPFKIPTADEMKQDIINKQNNTVFKSLGTEACGSLTCYKYTETDNGDASTVRTFWFDNQQYLTRKEEQQEGTATVMTTFNYDNISVNAPTPTKPVPAGHNIYEYMMGTPTAPAAAGSTSVQTGTQGKVPTQAEIDAMIKQAQAAQGSQASSPAPAANPYNY